MSRVDAQREPGGQWEKAARTANRRPRGSPEQIGRYRVLAEIGRGSMGRVFLAHDPNIERQVAVKVLLPPTHAESELESELQRRFVIEARAAGRLNHPNIVAVHDAGFDLRHRLAFIAMEWVDGQSLAQILKAHRRLPVEAAVESVAQVATALGYAHSQGVVHRDVKPANVLIGRDGRARVLDFGIAKLSAASQTLAGQTLGTPAYMSPEQVQARPVDGRSDLFSLGTVLYHCLTGDRPFEGDSVFVISHKVVNVDPRPPRNPEIEISDGRWEVIWRTLEKDPEKRFASGHELAAALHPYRSSDSEKGLILAGLLPVEAAAERPAGDAQAADGGVKTTGEELAFFPGGTDVTLETVVRPEPSGAAGGSWLRRLTARGRWRWVLPMLGAGALLLALLTLATKSRPWGLSVSETDPPPVAPSPEAEVAETPPAKLPRSIDTPPAAEESAPSGQVEDRAAAPAEATLVVRYKNRLKSAYMSIWIDGDKKWSEPIPSTGNFFERLRGEVVEATVSVRPGQRTIEIRVTGAKSKVDAAKIIRSRFEAGEVRHLRAWITPSVGKLKLAWKA